MKKSEIQENLEELIHYGVCAGMQEKYIKAMEAASKFIDGMLIEREDIGILTECSCPQHPMCNCCDDHACYILGDTVIGMIDEAFKESEIEI